MPSGTHVARSVKKAMITSMDQAIVAGVFGSLVVNRRLRARHLGRNIYVKLRLCEERDASQRGAEAFCDFVAILYYDFVLRFCVAILLRFRGF